MGKSTQSAPKKDLASRAFNNFYFSLAWLLSMVVAMRLVWPLRNALLVIWVYGENAYFHQGIRVIQNKPTLFSNGAPSPEIPNMITGFGVFLITALGLTLLLVHALRFYEKHFSGVKYEAISRVRWLPIVRDVFIVLILLEFAPIVVGIFPGDPGHESNRYTAMDAFCALLLGITGFTISGCLARPPRWSHLASVAFGAGLFCFLKGIFIEHNILGAVLAWVTITILMGIGGLVSYMFKRDNLPPN